MKWKTIVFWFEDKITEDQDTQIKEEFNELIEGIKDAMKKAEHKTTNELRHAMLRTVRENVEEYIKLEKVNSKMYHMHLQVETLRTFDVYLPINGVKTTADQLAERIAKDFVWDISRTTTIKEET